MSVSARTVTILFTDLVGSTELLQRQGDEKAQRIFAAHHRLLREAVESHGGHEIKWLGDGLMVAFDSAHQAVRCAIAMQQASRRPTAGERLQIRAGLNVGEALVDESDYFGTSVVVARRLCDRADAGQIFTSDLVARLLDGIGAGFELEPLGPLALKGMAKAVEAVEVRYRHDPMALLRKLPFVGRRAEYEGLLAKLAEARSGRGWVVLLSGEPGIGKTRLAEEFCQQASSSALILRGNCYEGDVVPPFGPWVEALRSLVARLPDDPLREALAEGAPAIAVLLPELRRRLPDTGTAPKLDPESERARLFAAIAAFLETAAGQRPLVVFLDDLHWCDKPSLSLLEFVARAVGGQRIVLVGTYRDLEVDRVHPLAQTLAALRRLEHHERLALVGFPLEEVDALLTAIEPSEESEAERRLLSAALSRQTEGNPLFLREVITSLIESGKIVHEQGRWTSHVASVEELEIPEGVREAIGRRLSRLSEGCRQMLGRASAFPNGFTWEELAAVSDESEDGLLDQLDEALGAQLIAERGRGQCAFTHALIRATLYEEMSLPRRARLHRRIAESLETLYADEIDAHLGELAAHYVASMGGQAEKAVEYSIRAGRRARQLVAWEEAAEHFRRALAAMPERGGRERRCRALLDIGECLLNSGQAAEAVKAYEGATEGAREIDSPGLLGEAACGFEEAGSVLAGNAAPAERRLAVVDEALARLGTADSALRARLLAQRVRAAHSVAGGDDPNRSAGWGSALGHWTPEEVRRIREAEEVAGRVGEPAVVAEAARQLFWMIVGGGREDETRRVAERWIQAAQAADDRALEADAWHALFQAALAQGDIGAARSADERATRIADRFKLGRAGYLSVVRKATLALHEGRLQDAEASTFDGLQWGLDAHDATAQLHFAAHLFQLRWYQGRLAELEPLWRGVAQQSPDVAVFQTAHAAALLEAGQPDAAARIVLTLAARGFKRIPRDSGWRSATSGMADICYRIGLADSAAELYETILEFPDGNASSGDTQSFGAVRRHLGQLATLLGRLDEAARHYEGALRLNGDMGHAPALAQTRRDCAELLVWRGASGDRERACRLLEQSLEAAREMGMAKVAADCGELLGKASR